MTMNRSSSILTVVLLAVGLTVLFWLPLWQGGGFIGGDVYSYYLPQKTFYAEQLQQGELPLWNNRSGHGYPLIAESQTGVFYPPNLALYSLLNVNTAYNVNHLLHYLLAFFFCWMYARSVGLNGVASTLTALVYTCGWFPARNCLEWAIIGGAWLPLVLWCVERFFKTHHWRYAIGLSIALAMQMLSGHYNIAFITQILLIVYIPARLWLAQPQEQPENTSPKRLLTMTVLAVLFGFALSAVQLIPTWQLRQHSQRVTAGEHHLLAQGSNPIGYWSQLILPWKWYSVNVDRNAELLKMAHPLGAPTNQVEAHLYLGLVPLGLVFAGIIFALHQHNRLLQLWLLLGSLALIYSSGLLIPVTQHIPGFSFFQGPGRWGIVTTLAGGLIAGFALQHIFSDRFTKPLATWSIALFTGIAFLSTWLLAADTDSAIEEIRTRNPSASSPLEFAGWELSEPTMTTLAAAGILLAFIGVLLATGVMARRSPSAAAWGKRTLVGLVFLVTLIDFWIVSRQVTESTMISDPPINHLTESQIYQILQKEPPGVRLLAPYPNFPNVLGVSSVPAYLTFGPAAYVDPELTMPTEPVSAKINWLQTAGVTHILSFEALPEDQWPVTLLWQGTDRLLNPAMGRFQEPLYLYRITGSRGRAAFDDAASTGTTRITELSSSRIVVETESDNHERLILTELMYPGWNVTIDSQPATPLTHDKMFRATDLPPGKHTVVWTYQPQDVYWGAGISGIAFLILAGLAHIRFWHPNRLRFPNQKSATKTT